MRNVRAKVGLGLRAGPGASVGFVSFETFMYSPVKNNIKDAAARATPCPFFAYKALTNTDTLHIRLVKH